MIRAALLALALASAPSTLVKADPQITCSELGCFSAGPATRPSQRPQQPRRARSAYPATFVAHPTGCPRKAFCGCGASVRVFGHSVRGLWLARAWYRFPRAAPAGGMVAVRPGHVFVLEAHLGGDTWRVYDANSGGGKTRIHARSIRGYTIVNPHGGARYATASK